MKLCTLASAALVLQRLSVCSAEEAAKDEDVKKYVAPDTDGLHWAETFDGDVWTRWSHSSAEKYTGKFTVDTRKQEGLVGDVGLQAPEEAKHYGIASGFKPITGQKDVPFVVQFEVKFQDGLNCGGAYIKLFDGVEAQAFDADTRYQIMFGPDRCGDTNKVHFILQHKSPKTGIWEEKHFKDAPAAPRDQLTHHYALIINPDNSFEVRIDGKSSGSGSNLLTSMKPPVNPAKEIDDPEDNKPVDWVDEARIDDPASSKPDEWDEDAPSSIIDSSVSMPSGWLEDAPKQINDPGSKKPDDWDDEEDGEWEPPIINNPACAVGCGKWQAPTISNPEYKGKWYAPKIDNPEYKGVWKAKQIANPDYFNDEFPSILPTISAVGIDIWTMNGGILFDNFVIATDVAKAQAFMEKTWQVRKEIEDLQQPKPSKSGFAYIQELVVGNPQQVGFTIVAVFIATLWCCCLRGSGSAPKASKTEKKAKSVEKNGDASDKKEDVKKGVDDEKEEKADEKESKKE